MSEVDDIQETNINNLLERNMVYFQATRTEL